MIQALSDMQTGTVDVPTGQRRCSDLSTKVSKNASVDNYVMSGHKVKFVFLGKPDGASDFIEISDTGPDPVPNYAKRRPGMLASVVTGQYCSVHQLLFINSLQEWLSFSPAHIAHAFGDAMQVVEATCPRCLAMAQTAMQRQFPVLYAPSSGPVRSRA